MFAPTLIPRTATFRPGRRPAPRAAQSPASYAADFPTGRGPAIVPVVFGGRWMVADPECADGGRVYIAIVRRDGVGGTSDRRHVYVWVPSVLDVASLGDRRAAYVRNLLGRCRLYRRWQLESLWLPEA